MAFAFLKINIEMEYLTVRTEVMKNQVTTVHNFYTQRLKVPNSFDFKNPFIFSLKTNSNI